jgi:hypothetical protein
MGEDKIQSVSMFSIEVRQDGHLDLAVLRTRCEGDCKITGLWGSRVVHCDYEVV